MNFVEKKQRMTTARAFTLVELLVVIGIILLLTAISIPSFQRMSLASEFTTAGQVIAEQLSLARQAALTQNRSVQVRFYQLSDPKTSSEKGYRALQLFTVDAEGSKPLSKPIYLPHLMMISEDEKTTSLMKLPEKTPGANFPPLPEVGLNYQYRCFHFKPDGGTDLAIDQSWFLTLYAKSDAKKKSETGLPANFVTFQIDPRNGRVRQFRP